MIKPTLAARAVAEFCGRENRLAASIFFINGLPNTTTFFTRILEQLTEAIPTIGAHVQKVILEDPDILIPKSTDELQELLVKLVIHPLAMATLPITPKVVVLDSLEHCEEFSESGSSWLTIDIVIHALVWLAESLHKNQLPLRLFLVSLAPMHRRAKTNIPKFRSEVRSLYLDPQGLLDSSLDGTLMRSSLLFYQASRFLNSMGGITEDGH